MPAVKHQIVTPDFLQLSTTDPLRIDRIDAALKYLIAAGIPGSKAVSLIAVSVNEGAVIWGTPRQLATPDSMWWPDSIVCNNYRQIVGWESASSSNPLALPSEILNDQATMAYLAGRGGLDASSQNLQAPFFHGFDSNGADCFELARLLEWAIDQRNPAPLRALSLGPTQMSLQFSGLYTGGPNKPGYPTTWDELFTLYNAPDPGAFADLIIYLDPPATMLPDYPADHPDDDSANMHWLQFQTGGTNFDQTVAGYPASYYENNGAPQTMYNGWLWRVLNRAGPAHLALFP